VGEVAELGDHYWHGHCAGNSDPKNEDHKMDPAFLSLSIALCTGTVLLSVTLSHLCRRGSFSSLRKREREEGPSFEPDSKRAKLDEGGATSNQVAPETVGLVTLWSPIVESSASASPGSDTVSGLPVVEDSEQSEAFILG